MKQHSNTPKANLNFSDWLQVETLSDSISVNMWSDSHEYCLLFGYDVSILVILNIHLFCANCFSRWINEGTRPWSQHTVSLFLSKERFRCFEYHFQCLCLLSNMKLIVEQTRSVHICYQVLRVVHWPEAARLQAARCFISALVYLTPVYELIISICMR